MTFNAISFTYQNRAFEENLNKALALLDRTSSEDISLLPELCLSGYSYEQLDIVASKADLALEAFLQSGKTVGFTMSVKENGKFYNRFFMVSEGEVKFTQDKHKLFPLGDEPRYFSQGEENFQLYTCRGLKIGLLICFELRFVHLWESFRGADVILVPAFWAKTRESHFMTLLKALAITNQCYVIASNTKDEANGSGVIDPFGVHVLGANRAINSLKYDAKVAKTVRQYINLGIR